MQYAVRVLIDAHFLLFKNFSEMLICLFFTSLHLRDILPPNHTDHVLTVPLPLSLFHFQRCNEHVSKERDISILVL